MEIDLLGAAFLIGAVVCLLLALQWGGSTYPWSDSKVFGNFIGFGLLITIFIYIQYRRGDRATLPPRILTKQRTVIAVAVFSFFLALGVYVIIYCECAPPTTSWIELTGIVQISQFGSKLFVAFPPNSQVSEPSPSFLAASLQP